MHSNDTPGLRNGVERGGGVPGGQAGGFRTARLGPLREVGIGRTGLQGAPAQHPIDARPEGAPERRHAAVRRQVGARRRGHGRRQVGDGQHGQGMGRKRRRVGRVGHGRRRVLLRAVGHAAALHEVLRRRGTRALQRRTGGAQGLTVQGLGGGLGLPQAAPGLRPPGVAGVRAQAGLGPGGPGRGVAVFVGDLVVAADRGEGRRCLEAPARGA
mmetsp:Transcript_66104/g.110328  ORF Transcript_66104/g.110328 Transcript_66104/m.110328 type:complete len:213 (+) Transcript_66104:386-1024(+)